MTKNSYLAGRAASIQVAFRNEWTNGRSSYERHALDWRSTCEPITCFNRHKTTPGTNKQITDSW